MHYHVLYLILVVSFSLLIKLKKKKKNRTAVKQQITRFISPVTCAVSVSLSHRTAGKGSDLLKES